MSEPKDAPAPRGMLRVPLVSLNDCECRWAVEEAPKVVGGHLFCGRGTGTGQVYCPEHKDQGRVIWRKDDA